MLNIHSTIDDHLRIVWTPTIDENGWMKFFFECNDNFVEIACTLRSTHTHTITLQKNKIKGSFLSMFDEQRSIKNALNVYDLLCHPLGLNERNSDNLNNIGVQQLSRLSRTWGWGNAFDASARTFPRVINLDDSSNTSLINGHNIAIKEDFNGDLYQDYKGKEHDKFDILKYGDYMNVTRRHFNSKSQSFANAIPLALSQVNRNVDWTSFRISVHFVGFSKQHVQMLKKYTTSTINRCFGFMGRFTSIKQEIQFFDHENEINPQLGIDENKDGKAFKIIMDSGETQYNVSHTPYSLRITEYNHNKQQEKIDHYSDIGLVPSIGTYGKSRVCFDLAFGSTNELKSTTPRLVDSRLILKSKLHTCIVVWKIPFSGVASETSGGDTLLKWHVDGQTVVVLLSYTNAVALRTVFNMLERGPLKYRNRSGRLNFKGVMKRLRCADEVCGLYNTKVKLNGFLHSDLTTNVEATDDQLLFMRTNALHSLSVFVPESGFYVVRYGYRPFTQPVNVHLDFVLSVCPHVQLIPMQNMTDYVIHLSDRQHLVNLLYADCNSNFSVSVVRCNIDTYGLLCSSTDQSPYIVKNVSNVDICTSDTVVDFLQTVDENIGIFVKCNSILN